jgi:hypothetical protein
LLVKQLPIVSLQYFLFADELKVLLEIGNLFGREAFVIIPTGGKPDYHRHHQADYGINRSLHLYFSLLLF